MHVQPGLELGMLAASGWNAGGTWVVPEEAGLRLYTVAVDPMSIKDIEELETIKEGR